MSAPPTPGRVALVTEGGAHNWGIVNLIATHFGPPIVVIEDPESKSALLRRRARKLGWISTAGQLGTMVVIRLSKVLYAQKAAIAAERYGLDISKPASELVVRVGSANSAEMVEAVAKADVVLLAGCRLLGRETLAAIKCPVLNYHAGITPKYRGMNGGYWALATGDAGNFGSTVHIVDPGVDTGSVLYQARGKPSKGDTIATYALTQAALSRDIIVSAIADALAGNLRPIDPRLPSQQLYHPTLWRYLWTGISRNVW